MIKLKNFLKYNLRAVIIIGTLTNRQSISAEKLVEVDKPESLSLEKLSYFRADLIVVGKYSTNLSMKDIVNILCEYSHEAGVVLIISKDKLLEDLMIKSKFRKTEISNLYIKKMGDTPKAYDLDYLKRWGETDFMKNWKIAGEQILTHMPSRLDKTSVRILDVGCLNGYIMETLRKHGIRNVYGTDISYEIAIKHCIDNYHLPAITVGDFCENNYPDNFSDLTIAMEILEHIPPEKTDLFIKQLKRVTSEKGVILISTSEDMNIDPTHVNCKKRYDWFYIFAKHGLTPVGRQVIFPGFNSFVFKKSSSLLYSRFWQTVGILGKKLGK